MTLPDLKIICDADDGVCHCMEWCDAHNSCRASDPDQPAPGLEVAPGVYRLEDKHHAYAVPSASTDRIHQVTVNTRTGAMRCDGPRCDGRTCSHQRRVLAARAGF